MSTYGDLPTVERVGSVIRGTSIGDVYRPEPFTWGRVVYTHRVGPYAIVESIRGQYGNEDDEEFYAKSVPELTRFHPYIYEGEVEPWDTGHSYRSLDEALAAAITMRQYRERGDHNGALNERASGLFMKMIGPEVDS